MKNLNYEHDSHFIMHQPFFYESVQSFREIMQTEPYQALFYEFQTNNDDSSKAGITYIPNGCTDILFVLDKYGSHMEILGSSIEVKRIHRIKNARYFGVRLKPGMFICYHNLTLRDITNQELFFEEMEDTLEIFFQKLEQSSSLNEKMNLFHAYMDSYIHISEVNPLTGYILSEINSTQGNVRIHELAEELHYSERHISRIFQDSMGITPKTFARIVRFQNVIDSILQQPMLSLCDYMSELGYSDQAHFQREFKQYTGITPRHFLIFARNNAELCQGASGERQAS